MSSSGRRSARREAAADHYAGSLCVADGASDRDAGCRRSLHAVWSRDSQLWTPPAGAGSRPRAPSGEAAAAGDPLPARRGRWPTRGFGRSARSRCAEVERGSTCSCRSFEDGRSTRRSFAGGRGSPCGQAEAVTRGWFRLSLGPEAALEPCWRCRVAASGLALGDCCGSWPGRVLALSSWRAAGSPS